jgi:hypothetical protein
MKNQGIAPKMQPKRENGPVIMCKGEREEKKQGFPNVKPIVKRQVPVVSRKAEKKRLRKPCPGTLRWRCAATQP